MTAIDENLADLSPRAKRASADGDGAFIEDFCNWTRLPAMERFIRESPGAEIAAELTGSDTTRLYHDHVLVKEPGTKQRTPWHQDQPYYNVDGIQNASMWFPVDPVDRSATLEFIAGTHRGPWYMPRTFLDDQAKWFPDGSLAELPDFAADNENEPGRWRVLGWELEPGDAVFFNMLTVHGSGGVSGTQPSPRPVGALPRRRHGARATSLDDVATVRRSRRRTRRGCPDGPSAVPDAVDPIRRAGRGRDDRSRRAVDRPPDVARRRRRRPRR